MSFSRLIFFFSILYHNFATADRTTEYVQQLEQKLRESEQKQAAVLANVLSKLQSQQQTIQELTDELQNITAKLNSTTQFSSGGHVTFEASTSKEGLPSLVYFQNVILNEGGGYDAHSGVFTAPSTGTYQLWFSVYVSAYNLNLSSNMISLVVPGTSFIGQMSPLKVTQDPTQDDEDVRLVQGLHVVRLSAGDIASVYLHNRGKVRPGSFFGGMLLR